MYASSILGIPMAQDSGTNSTSSSSGSSSTSSSRSSSLQELGPDAFITLLTAQLQAQDPLNPMDPNQMVDELTSMNTLQEVIQMRQDLDALATAAGVSTTGSSGSTGSGDGSGSGTGGRADVTKGGSSAEVIAALMNATAAPQSANANAGGTPAVATAAMSSALAAMMNSMVSRSQATTGAQTNSK